MSRHLTNIELVDYAENALDAHRAAHLKECADCRSRAESLRAEISTFQQTANQDIPEPSPLFWEHFSRRIQDTLDQERPSGFRVRWSRPALLAAAASAVVVSATALMFWNERQTPSQLSPTPASVVTSEPVPQRALEPRLDLESDVEWDLVRTVAEDLRWDEAADAGIHARPGSAERVALEMSAEERRELARLIEDEMKRTGA